jgi:hypothetical protein
MLKHIALILPRLAELGRAVEADFSDVVGLRKQLVKEQ